MFGFAILVGGLVCSLSHWHPIAILLTIVGPVGTAAFALLLRFIVEHHRWVGRVLQRVALLLLVGAIVGTGVGIFGGMLFYDWIDGMKSAATNDAAALTHWGGELTVREISTAFPAWLPEGVAFVVWPFQFTAVRDFIALGVLFGLLNIIAVFMIWWERKIAGRMQSRLGPMRVGGWHGWAQTIADGVKLVFKEDFIPDGADKTLFRLAAYLAFVPVFVAFAALPFGLKYVVRDLDVALVFILAMMGVEVMGVILAGWASNNKWSVYGAMREACQMVSYEIPMGLALILPVIAAGTLNLTQIADQQAGWWFNWFAFKNPFLFAGFLCYYVASLASCKRAPFDLPESESELVAGFHTEYSGFRWSLFFFGEYAAMFVVSALATILYLGAWNSPFSVEALSSTEGGLAQRTLRGLLIGGPVWFLLKCLFLLYVQLWIRWTLPRIRIDQVLYCCIQVLLPLTMLLLLGQSLWIWAEAAWGSAEGVSVWMGFARLVNLLLGLVGALFMLGFVGIAGYGFYNRRRLVRLLVKDPLPAG